MRKAIFWTIGLVGIVVAVFLMMALFAPRAYAYNPNSFTDEERVTVEGNRPKVDIEVSEVTVKVDPEDFRDGVAEKTITVSNEGNVPCRLNLVLKDVPVDLEVTAEVDDDFLLKGESTSLNITIKLTDMQETESFLFTLVVEADLR
jgi:hypothetical protein